MLAEQVATEDTTAPDRSDTPPATIDATVAPDPPDTVAANNEVTSPTGTPIAIGVVYAETGRVAGAYGMSDDVAIAWANGAMRRWAE